jgi:hypothetical protein
MPSRSNRSNARHQWSGSSHSVWSKSSSALGALEEVEGSRRETVVMPGSLTTGVPEVSLKNPGGCRTGAVLFVVEMRPPTRGGAKGKEPRS